MGMEKGLRLKVVAERGSCKMFSLDGKRQRFGDGKTHPNVDSPPGCDQKGK
jgi:hypothetical protein